MPSSMSIARIARSVWSRKALCSRTASSQAGNPLIQSLSAPLPAWDEISAAHVKPGIGALIEEAERELSTVEANLEAHGYDVPANKLIGDLERLTDRLGRGWGIVGHLKSVKDTPELRAAVEEVCGLVHLPFRIPWT